MSDYEVFILSQIREAYDEHGDTPGSRRRISRTGKLVTALALGIAIDAFVVRALLTPALVAVLGRAD